MNAITYISKRLILPFQGKEALLKEENNIADQKDAFKTVENAKDIQPTEIVCENETLRNIGKQNKLIANETSKTGPPIGNKTILGEKPSLNDRSDMEESNLPVFGPNTEYSKTGLLSRCGDILFSVPNFLLIKPIFFIWFLIRLPITFIERGIKLRNRSTKPYEQDVISGKPSLSAINENAEDDPTTGDGFYLQRDIIKGSLSKASAIRHFSPSKLIRRNVSTSSQVPPTSTSDNVSYSSAAVLGSKKMGRFLFPKKLIPNSILLTNKRKTLVIDLDETLIHSNSRGTTHVNSSQAHIIEVRFSISNVSTLYYVYKRPFCDLFLAKVSKWYDIIIFTASMKEYADPVIDWLEVSFPGKFLKRLYRDDCTLREGVGYIKDLRVISQYLLTDDLNDIIIIDNSPVSYAMNVDNAIQVEGWISDPTDTDLLNLIPILEALRYTTDVRSILSLKSGERAFHFEEQ